MPDPTPGPPAASVQSCGTALGGRRLEEGGGGREPAVKFRGRDARIPERVDAHDGGHVPAISVSKVVGEYSNENAIDLNQLAVGEDTMMLKKAGFGKVVIDSGAGESVMPWQMLPQEPLVASSRANSRYRDASGHEMANKGQKEIKMKINCKIASMVFQATDVRKPLAAVGRIVE